MSRRRCSIQIVDMWVTNNSDSATVQGSLRWALSQLVGLGLTNNAVIKFADVLEDIAGTGNNYTISGASIITPKGVNNLTIDFSNHLLYFTGTYGFNSQYGYTYYINARVENQNVTCLLFSNYVSLDNIVFSGLNGSTSNPFIFSAGGSVIRNCVFENLNVIYINVHSGGDLLFEDNIVDVSVNKYLFNLGDGGVVNCNRCYFGVVYTINFTNYSGIRLNFNRCFIENKSTATNVGLWQRINNGDVTNCTIVNVRLSSSTGSYAEQIAKIRQNTIIYTLSLGATIMNPMSLTGNTIVNNIIIAPYTNNIFPRTVDYIESGNLYLCANANAKFPNSTYYAASTPLTSLISSQQGTGQTYQRYYNPTITGNVARLADVLINQLGNERQSLTNSGAI